MQLHILSKFHQDLLTRLEGDELKPQSNSTIIPKHSPRALKTMPEKGTGYLVDLIAISTAIAILIFAIIAYQSSANTVYSWERQLLEVARIVRLLVFLLLFVN